MTSVMSRESICAIFTMLAFAPALAKADDTAAEAVLAAAPPEAEFGIRGTVEVGFLAPLAHDITFGRDGTKIDYLGDANQNNLFFFTRLQAELDIWRQHRITLLYQPLELVSTATLGRTLRIDGLDFPEATPVRFVYGFPFFRAGWSFDVLESRFDQLSFGLALQIRNATISMASLNGTLYRSREDVGPVPLLRVNGRFALDSRWYFGWELDGFYAPISVLNGSDTEVVGAIVDASVRVGVRLIPHLDTFVNVRYLGGGATGQGDPTPTSDGYQSNWLHFLTASLGVTIDSRP